MSCIFAIVIIIIIIFRFPKREFDSSTIFIQQLKHGRDQKCGKPESYEKKIKENIIRMRYEQSGATPEYVYLYKHEYPYPNTLKSFSGARIDIGYDEVAKRIMDE